MTRSILISSVIILFCIFACSPKIIVKYEKDSGSTCSLSLEDTLEIVLRSNPSTGYQWKMVSLDTTVLNNIDKSYIPDKVPKHTVGSGGKSIFHFVAVKKGGSQVKLIYNRPFEKGMPPIKNFVIMVKVR